MADWIVAIVLGIVEGITEFLPVSSTGHLIVATEWLGEDQDFWEVFNIAIQPGAILAIAVLYWRTFMDVLTGFFRGDRKAYQFIANVLIAFFPVVILALLYGDAIQLMLGNAVIVCWALIVGGVGMLVIEKWANPPAAGGGVADVRLSTALLVGLAQCISLIPGMSRAAATIMGAMAFGVDRKTAAEFSFFLAVPTLAGATVYQMAKNPASLSADYLGLIAIGSAVSFVVALVVVKAFVSVVTRYGFGPFAWYRIVVGAAGLFWLQST